MENSGKTALITGASSGIGYALAHCFAKNGHNVILVARDKARLEKLAEELAREYSVAAEVIPEDLSSPSSPDDLFTKVRERRMSVDFLVNNAGFNEYGEFSEVGIDKALGMIQVNVVALTRLTKLFLPGMTSRKYGRVLNVASTGAFVPGANNAVYCATKAYVLSFSEAIAEELKGSGVTVTALCPGATRTEFAKRADMESALVFKFGVMSAKDVAEVGYGAMMRGKPSVIAGFFNRLNIFSTRFAPRWLVTKLSKMLMSR